MSHLEYREPRPEGSRHQPRLHVGGYGTVTIANALFAAVVMVALIRSETAALTAILAGGAYYGLTTLCALAILNGTAADILTHRQEQVTRRELLRLQWQVLGPPALPEPHADPPQAPTAPSGLPPHSDTYVPAQPAPDDAARREAAAWVRGLFDDQGQLDGRKVLINTDRERPGRIRIALPKSPAAKQYLVDRGLVRDIGNGYRWNLQRCPTLADARARL